MKSYLGIRLNALKYNVSEKQFDEGEHKHLNANHRSRVSIRGRYNDFIENYLSKVFYKNDTRICEMCKHQFSICLYMKGKLKLFRLMNHFMFSRDPDIFIRKTQEFIKSILMIYIKLKTSGLLLSKADAK